jgi:predicted RNase H-like HicB family nuclease
MTKLIKIVVEKHADGYVAYPLGMKGVVVGEGDTYEEALADVKSAIQFHRDSFETQVLKSGAPEIERNVTEEGNTLQMKPQSPHNQGHRH